MGRFREQYGDGSITKWDIFYYVYGLLHHPGYRARFADNLKRELPRIPFAPAGTDPSPQTPLPQSGARGAGKKQTSRKTTKRSIDESPLSPSAGRGVGGEWFWAFATAAKQLAELHLNYEQLEPFPLQFIVSPEFPLSYRVESKMRLSRDKSSVAVNESLMLAGIPPQTYDYRLGNRSALEWVIDQYQVSTDKRSGIRSDPNRPYDEQYIVRLIGQVIRVSVDTVRLVASLPAKYSE